MQIRLLPTLKLQLLCSSFCCCCCYRSENWCPKRLNGLSKIPELNTSKLQPSFINFLPSAFSFRHVTQKLKRKFKWRENKLLIWKKYNKEFIDNNLNVANWRSLENLITQGSKVYIIFYYISHCVNIQLFQNWVWKEEFSFLHLFLKNSLCNNRTLILSWFFFFFKLVGTGWITHFLTGNMRLEISLSQHYFGKEENSASVMVIEPSVIKILTRIDKGWLGGEWQFDIWR